MLIAGLAIVAGLVVIIVVGILVLPNTDRLDITEIDDYSPRKDKR